MPVSIISDIAAAYREVKQNLSSISGKSDNIVDKAMGSDSNEARFFARPMSSVARAAKKSILYFPVVVSDTISPTAAVTVAKVIQVRAAEYVRLMVENMGPISAASSGKHEVIAALRGATLKDDALSETVQANEFVKTLIAESVEHIYADNFLNAPMEHLLLSEGKSGGNKSKDKRTNGATVNYDPSVNSMAQAAHSAQQAAGASSAAAAAAAARQAAAHAQVMASIKPAFTPPPVNIAPPNTSIQHQVEEQLYQVEDLLNNGPLGRKEAERILTRVMRNPQFAKYDIQDVIKQIDGKDDGPIAKLLSDLEISSLESDVRANRAKVDPEILEVQRQAKLQDERLQRALNFAKMTDASGNPSARAVAQSAQVIQEIIASGDTGAIDKLRKNPATNRIMTMLERLPEGVIRDGVIDLSNSGNKVTTINNIDFHKLNQFQPVLLSLQIRYQSTAGDPLDVRDTLTLGVKGVAHPVPSLDIITGLGTALQRDSILLQFFRMTSGETSFVKDFVLNLNVAKARSSARTTSGTKVLETLRRQTEWNSRRGNRVIASVANRGFIPPTTTMVITSDESNRIRNIYGIDFAKPAATRELLRSHNLMGFIIVDEAIGLVRVFEDGDDDFDRIPMDTFKNQGKETSVKDIMTILAQGR